MLGQVIKSENSRYYVYAEGNCYECIARGNLKNKHQTILTGDYVEFQNNCIENICERKNHLLRPNVANIDQICIVLASEPKPDYVLIDKLIINANALDLPVFIVVNKTDLSEEIYKYVIDNYRNVIETIICISAKNNINFDKLEAKLLNKFTVLAGQSAVGKTSIINSLFSLENKVGELSKKTLRGRHTTTHSEIYFNNNYKVIDSPGFAVLNANTNVEDLVLYYKEFLPFIGKCKFRTCTHDTEPNCAIKDAVSKNIISKDRYDRFLTIYKELLKEKKYNERN